MGLFPPGKGGGDLVDYGFKGKGVTIHAYVEGEGYPLAIISTSAKGDERKQVTSLLKSVKVLGKRRKPRSCVDKVQMDKGYDSQKLRNELHRKSVQPIIPRRNITSGKQRRGRKPPKLIDRWKVERAFAWFQKKFRRICIKWERRINYWTGFIQLAISWVWLTKLVVAG
jgi:transposase